MIKYRSETLGSTTISQFPAEDSGFILVILNKDLFVFSSNGEHLVNQTTSISKAKFPSYIVTNGHSGLNFYFTLIYCYIYPSNEQCTHIHFIKYIFNSSTKSLPNIEGAFNPQVNNMFATISCHLMKKDDNDYITSVYGEYGKFYVSVLDQNNNYNNINTVYKAVGGVYIKSEVLLPERNKLFICTYVPDYTTPIYCLSYDIGTYSLSTNVEELQNTCGYQPISLNLFYF